MPPKQKKGKPKAQDPQSENDFLETADEHEQAAGKWRAGDAVKATRFFTRAIDTYNEGLKRFSKSFDLAYNKANLEYNLTQDDRVLPHLGPRVELLEETLKSHQIALALSPPSNTDIVFNTAQVLTSLAEAVLDAESQQTAKVPARTLLEEAVNLFTKCLVAQQAEYERLKIEMEAFSAQTEQGGQEQGGLQQPSVAGSEENLDSLSTTSSGPSEWATVEEPLTPETILETCTAQLGALATLFGLYDPSDIVIIEARAQIGLTTANRAVPTLIGLMQESPFKKEEEESSGPTLSIGLESASRELETTSKDDALLAVVSFQAALAELQYKASQTSSTQYASTIETLFSSFTQPLQISEQNPLYLNAIAAYADAFIDLASAISDTPSYSPTSPTYSTDIEVQWTSLNHAQKLLTQLSTPPNNSILPSSRLANIYLARGDVELFRFHMSFSSSAKSAWVTSRKVLIANAGVYYRGARTYAEKAGTADVRKMADAKALVAEVLKEVAAAEGMAVIPKEMWKGTGQAVKRVLEQMVDEGILGSEEAEGVLALLS